MDSTSSISSTPLNHPFRSKHTNPTHAMMENFYRAHDRHREADQISASSTYSGAEIIKAEQWQAFQVLNLVAQKNLIRDQIQAVRLDSALLKQKIHEEVHDKHAATQARLLAEEKTQAAEARIQAAEARIQAAEARTLALEAKAQSDEAKALAEAKARRDIEEKNRLLEAELQKLRAQLGIPTVPSGEN